MKYKVFMDITVSKILYDIEAETDEQAQAIALEKVKNEPYYYAAHADGFVKAEVEDFDTDEEEPAKPMTFSELCDELQYFSVDDSQQKTIGEIADECRGFIRKAGHACLDDGWDSDADAKDWMEEHHPELASDDIGQTAVTYHDLEFLCEDEYSGDPYFAELHITFYGDYDKGVGVFSVTND